jgi:hypothetical protein
MRPYSKLLSKKAVNNPLQALAMGKEREGRRTYQMSKHPKYSREVLEALKGSIKKWEGIAYEGKKNLASEDCPLCWLFNHYPNAIRDCKGCPIYNETGQSACQGTPYMDYIRYQSGGSAEAFLHWLQDLYRKLTKEDREVVPTAKDLTIGSLAREINWSNEMEVGLLGSFRKWAMNGGFSSGDLVHIGKQYSLCIGFIPEHPEFADLLVKYGFAEWEEEESKRPGFKPFTIEVKTLEEAQDLGFAAYTFFGDTLNRIQREIYNQLTKRGFRK